MLPAANMALAGANGNGLDRPCCYIPAMTQPISLFVVGSVVVACIARTGRMPGAGETVAADDFMIELGGKGFNVAVAAMRLDACVDGLFAVGDDNAASFARAAFGQAGLDAALLLTLPGKTGRGVGLIEPGGENRIAVHSGANARLTATHALSAAARIARADMVLAQFEAGDSVIAAAFAAARRSGVRTLLNPSPFRPIAAEILATADMIVVNRVEAAALAASLELEWTASSDHGQAEMRLARHLFARGHRRWSSRRGPMAPR